MLGYLRFGSCTASVWGNPALLSSSNVPRVIEYRQLLRMSHDNYNPFNKSACTCYWSKLCGPDAPGAFNFNLVC